MEPQADVAIERIKELEAQLEDAGTSTRPGAVRRIVPLRDRLRTLE
jgi:hypothetical protein